MALPRTSGGQITDSEWTDLAPRPAVPDTNLAEDRLTEFGGHWGLPSLVRPPWLTADLVQVLTNLPTELSSEFWRIDVARG